MRRLVLGILPLVWLATACGSGGDDGRPPATDTAGSGPVATGGSLGPSAGTTGSGGTSSGNGGSSQGGVTATGGDDHGGPGPEVTACEAPKTGKPVLRLLTRNELERTLGDVFPQVKGQWTNALPAQQVSKLGFDNSSAASLGGQSANGLLETALSVASAVTGDALGTLLPCAQSGGDRACASEFVTRYGRRLFRRAVTAAETERYLGFFDTALAKSDFKTALKWVTVGLIQSPHAVYRSEIGTVQADGTRALTPTELATELAYTYTGSTPSEELLAEAEAGQLADPVSKAKALLATDAGKQTFQRFFEAYIGFPRAAAIQKPKVQAFSDVSADMVQETRRFIDEVLLQQGGGVRELLTAPSTNPSQRLAQYYGFPAPSGDYASVMRPAGRGVGLFAQGSFLATRASSDTSSPTQRGIFILSRLLCREPPAPPNTVPPLAQGPSGPITTRQRYEEAHAAGGCAGCHQLFDPIGFGFEHFDEAGRYRDDEQGLPVSSVSHVPAEDRSVLFEFASQEELMNGLAERPEVYQCFAGFLSTYAFGTTESCLGTSRVPELQAGTLGIADAFANLAAEPHFTRRSAN